MKALKTFVIGMGVLIACGIALLGYGLSRKSLVAPQDAVAVQTVPDPSATSAPFAVDLAVPPGSRIQQMEVSGDRLALRVATGTQDQILIVDPRTGRLAGRFNLVSEAK